MMVTFYESFVEAKLNAAVIVLWKSCFLKNLAASFDREFGDLEWV